MAAERYRLYADSTVGAQARQISAMRVVIETSKTRRRWGLGGAGGYCAVHVSGSAVRESLRYGAGVCAGVSFSFWFDELDLGPIVLAGL